VLIFTFLLLTALVVTIVMIRRQREALAASEERRVRELEEQRETFAAANRAERARVEAMLDAMIEGLVVIDVDRHIVLANRAAETMFGFSRMMAGGMLLEAIRHHEVAALARRAVTEPAPIEHEVRLEHPQPRTLQVSAVSLHDRKGGHAGAVLVFHDVTRLRQLEAVRQDFVANVSHELRTPLSLIKSATETLIDGGKNDPVVNSRFLDIIDRHASRLNLLIDDLLLLARLDSGRVELDLQTVRLRGAVQESFDDAAQRAQSRGVALVNEVADELMVEADAARLREILSNLIDNAIKYGREKGRVAVSARRAPAQMIEVSVRDDGPGIPVEAQPRVFERFYRVDKARSREQGGTGLGLAIVKNVVQAHGGDVRVESILGEGATFYFTVPAVT
jgi:two-component system, OmpR family, phosphate regulon sensor histidine kinase PhoR